MSRNRPVYPSPDLCKNLAVGLSLLAHHVKSNREHFVIEKDEDAILSASVIQEMAESFDAPLKLFSEESRRVSPGKAFFFESERTTVSAAFIILAQYQQDLGKAVAQEEIERIFGRDPGKLMSINDLAKHASHCRNQQPSIMQDYGARAEMRGLGMRDWDKTVTVDGSYEDVTHAFDMSARQDAPSSP